MLTDAQLLASIQADPFHQAMHEPCPVADMLTQLFPNAATEPSSLWTNTRTKARATFRPGSTRART